MRVVLGCYNHILKVAYYYLDKRLSLVVSLYKPWEARSLALLRDPFISAVPSTSVKYTCTKQLYFRIKNHKVKFKWEQYQSLYNLVVYSTYHLKNWGSFVQRWIQVTVRQIPNWSLFYLILTASIGLWSQVVYDLLILLLISEPCDKILFAFFKFIFVEFEHIWQNVSLV